MQTADWLGVIGIVVGAGWIVGVIQAKLYKKQDTSAVDQTKQNNTLADIMNRILIGQDKGTKPGHTRVSAQANVGWNVGKKKQAGWAIFGLLIMLAALLLFIR
jgi:hypothetical protein